ncbi:MtnX-like HAD-IB family phosphatase [Chloroflexota bacterium]
MADSIDTTKIMVQCDFDGTITQEDVSFMLLDAFADGNWRQLLEEYREGKMPVGDFNTRAFAMVKADRQTMVDLSRRKVKIREGFHELLDYCRRNGFQVVIVSNGLDFYIETILKDIGEDNIEVFAAQTRFDSGGLEVKYIGPDGSQLLSGFKDAYTRLFISRGYRVIYIGNGLSDASPARLAYRTFATGELLDCCREFSLDCVAFDDLNDVVRDLESLERG